MRLQDVLKEREAEISLLEESLKAAESKAHDTSINIKTNGSVIAPPLLHIESGDGDGDSEFLTPMEGNSDYVDRSGRSTPVSSPIPPVNLSPKTTNQFKAIRNSLDFGGSIEADGQDSAPSRGEDDLLGRLNELMR